MRQRREFEGKEQAASLAQWRRQRQLRARAQRELDLPGGQEHPSMADLGLDDDDLEADRQADFDADRREEND